ncbi:hypothetical protein O181_091307 [Austropuccinia psidii MF-1]|uniref:Uncharacterized protein n=1 Tax=Austropuccinia psidii MF-1 TaxID=1389203 RepID=A0A9Q3IX24_9BASI|nr:hypothetical protein [Austropuccinia psidii MF-1]
MAADRLLSTDNAGRLRNRVREFSKGSAIPELQHNPAPDTAGQTEGAGVADGVGNHLQNKIKVQPTGQTEAVPNPTQPVGKHNDDPTLSTNKLKHAALTCKHGGFTSKNLFFEQATGLAPAASSHVANMKAESFQKISMSGTWAFCPSFHPAPPPSSISSPNMTEPSTQTPLTHCFVSKLPGSPSTLEASSRTLKADTSSISFQLGHPNPKLKASSGDNKNSQVSKDPVDFGKFDCMTPKNQCSSSQHPGNVVSHFICKTPDAPRRPRIYHKLTVDKRCDSEEAGCDNAQSKYSNTIGLNNNLDSDTALKPPQPAVEVKPLPAKKTGCKRRVLVNARNRVLIVTSTSSKPSSMKTAYMPFAKDSINGLTCCSSHHIILQRLDHIEKILSLNIHLLPTLSPKHLQSQPDTKTGKIQLVSQCEGVNVGVSTSPQRQLDLTKEDEFCQQCENSQLNNHGATVKSGIVDVPISSLKVHSGLLTEEASTSFSSQTIMFFNGFQSKNLPYGHENKPRATALITQTPFKNPDPIFSLQCSLNLPHPFLLKKQAYNLSPTIFPTSLSTNCLVNSCIANVISACRNTPMNESLYSWYYDSFATLYSLPVIRDFNTSIDCLTSMVLPTLQLIASESSYSSVLEQCKGPSSNSLSYCSSCS